MYTNDWFKRNIPIWEKSLASFKGLQLEYLEIGSYEGQSAVWMLENILTHEKSHATCVDIFSSNEELAETDWKKVERNFKTNTKPFREKITLVKEDSKTYLKRRWQMADIIYIDGSHLASDCLLDSVQAHLLLKQHGIIIFDDYLWNGLEKFSLIPKPAVDAFMECFAPLYNVVSISYQVILQKK